jgi:cell wall-associated NlpC family hydrolase
VTSWFENISRRITLRRVAQSWLGTPFRANSSTKGMGVSCQKLVSEVYREVGFCDVEVPSVPMSYARFSRKESLVENFMATRSEFAIVDSADFGDLLGFRFGKVVHHLGISLGNGEFVHALYNQGVSISRLDGPAWMTRLVRIWRPLA